MTIPLLVVFLFLVPAKKSFLYQNKMVDKFDPIFANDNLLGKRNPLNLLFGKKNSCSTMHLRQIAINRLSVLLWLGAVGAGVTGIVCYGLGKPASVFWEYASFFFAIAFVIINITISFWGEKSIARAKQKRKGLSPSQAESVRREIIASYPNFYFGWEASVESWKSAD